MNVWWRLDRGTVAVEPLFPEGWWKFEICHWSVLRSVRKPQNCRDLRYLEASVPVAHIGRSIRVMFNSRIESELSTVIARSAARVTVATVRAIIGLSTQDKQQSQWIPFEMSSKSSFKEKASRDNSSGLSFSASTVIEGENGLTCGHGKGFPRSPRNEPVDRVTATNRREFHWPKTFRLQTFCDDTSTTTKKKAIRFSTSQIKDGQLMNHRGDGRAWTMLTNPKRSLKVNFEVRR